jgi:hypothetical protein
MPNFNYTLVDQCTVVAYDPDRGKVEWRRCLRTYFRDTRKFPIVSIQVFEETITASWRGSVVTLFADSGKVKTYLRSMSYGKGATPVFSYPE